MATTLLVVENRAYSKLAAAIDDDDTSLTVTAGAGADFPSAYPFHLTIEDEIVSCTNRTTDTLTIDRAQQGTSPAAHAKKSYVALNITAKSITDLNTAVNTIEDEYIHKDGSVAFTGTQTFNAGITVIGAAVLAGGLNVYGAALLHSGLGVAGATALQATLIHSSLGVAGTTNLNVTLIHSSLGVAGLATFANININSLTSGRVVFAGASGRLTDDGDFTFATDTLTVTKIAGTEFTGAVTGISLSEIENLEADKTFTMAAKKLQFNFTTPSEGLVLEATGAFTDHLLHLHQTGGSPSAGVALIHLLTDHANVIHSHYEHTGDHASHPAVRYQLNRATPTDNDNIIISYYFDHDGTVTSQGELEFIKITGKALDVSEDSEDASYTISLMKAGSMTDILTIASTGITVSGALAITTANGLDVNPGSDIDADLITVSVTGTPRLYWDESGDAFRFTKRLHIQSVFQSDSNQPLTMRQGESDGSGGHIALGEGGTYSILLATPDAAGTANRTRLIITGDLATAVWTFANSTLTGIVLSGALNFNSQALNNLGSLDATSEGVIEAAIDTLANLTSVQGHTLTLTGNLVMVNAHNLTFTLGAATNVTLPSTGTLATLAGTEELDNKTLDSSVAKGTWTASGTWTLPAFTLGGNIDAANNELLNVGAAYNDWTATSLHTSERIDIQGASGAMAALVVWTYSTTPGDHSELRLIRSNHNTVGSHGAVDANDVLGCIEFWGSDGNSYTESSKMKAIATET